MSEDLQRDLTKARERARIAEESVDRKIETIEEENFKLSRARVCFYVKLITLIAVCKLFVEGS